jgi:DNA invertase Pin-like site-specific DNA recombinase
MMGKYTHGAPGAKTSDEIRRMREAREYGVPLEVIGRRFGISRETVSWYLNKRNEGENAIPKARTARRIKRKESAGARLNR